MIIDWKSHDRGLEIKLQNCAVMNCGWSPQSGASVMSRKCDLTLSFWDLVQVWTRSEENDSVPHALRMSEAHLRTPHRRFLRQNLRGTRGCRSPRIPVFSALQLQQQCKRQREQTVAVGHDMRDTMMGTRALNLTGIKSQNCMGGAEQGDSRGQPPPGDTMKTTARDLISTQQGVLGKQGQQSGCPTSPSI